MLNVLDFPAPLDPRSPKISRLEFRSKEMPLTACTFPEYVFVKFFVCRNLESSFIVYSSYFYSELW